MAFNPLNLLSLKDKFRVFREEHPEMRAFGKKLNQDALVPGSKFAIRVTTPQGEVVEQEIVMTENDVEIVQVFVNR